MEMDPYDPRLHTHEYENLKGAKGEQVFESYVETKTPAAAHRIFWQGSPLEKQITVLAITPYRQVRRGTP
jgi:hypothetical protein